MLNLRVTESRLWATVGTGTPAGPPDIPVSESVAGITEGRSVGLGAHALPAAEALGSVMVNAVAQLGDIGEVSQATVSHPTQWGGPRRSLLAAAVAQVASAPFVTPVALSTAATHAGLRGSVSGRTRCLVVEFDALSTTASYVSYDVHGSRIESCAHSPILSASELGTTAGRAELADLLTEAAGGRSVEALILLGSDHDPSLAATVEAVVSERYPGTIAIREVSAAEIVRPAVSLQPPREERNFEAPAAWLDASGSAALSGSRSNRTRWLVAAAAVAAVVVTATVIGVTQTRSTTTTSTTATSAAPAPAVVTAGRLMVEIPPQWRQRESRPGDGRVVLVPADGARRRITVDQQPEAALTLDQVISGLQRELAPGGPHTTPGSRYSQVTRGTHGPWATADYNEIRNDNDQVKWHVIVKHGVQVTVGCQNRPGEGDAITGACEQTVAALQIGP